MEEIIEVSQLTNNNFSPGGEAYKQHDFQL